LTAVHQLARAIVAELIAHVLERRAMVLAFAALLGTHVVVGVRIAARESNSKAETRRGSDARLGSVRSSAIARRTLARIAAASQKRLSDHPHP
jgi:hypothetical protein